MFFAPRKPKTTVFTMSFALGGRNHSIYSVFWPAPSKNTGIYVAFSMLQKSFSMPKQQNSVNYSVMAFGTHQQKQQESAKKCPKWTFQT